MRLGRQRLIQPAAGSCAFRRFFARTHFVLKREGHEEGEESGGQVRCSETTGLSKSYLLEVLQLCTVMGRDDAEMGNGHEVSKCVADCSMQQRSLPTDFGILFA